MKDLERALYRTREVHQCVWACSSSRLQLCIHMFTTVTAKGKKTDRTSRHIQAGIGHRTLSHSTPATAPLVCVRMHARQKDTVHQVVHTASNKGLASPRTTQSKCNSKAAMNDPRTAATKQPMNNNTHTCAHLPQSSVTRIRQNKPSNTHGHEPKQDQPSRGQLQSVVYI